jgi:hypothetical protein
MKWTGMYLLGFVILVGGLLAALWKLGILATIGTTWTVIGVVRKSHGSCARSLATSSRQRLKQA